MNGVAVTQSWMILYSRLVLLVAGIAALAVLDGTGAATEAERDLGAALVFSDPADRVRDVLVRHGFNLAAAGQWRQPDYSGGNPAPIMGVQTEDGGATLYCAN